MSHEIETIAWTGETPWHGLGVEIDPLQDVLLDDWLRISGLDWEVEMQPLFLPNGKRAGTQSALVRTSDDKCLTFASENWKPLQNRQILEFFKDYVDAGGATMETLGSLNGGRTVWGLAKLAASYKVRGSDAVLGYLLLQGSHEAGNAHQARTTAVRVVCRNTLEMANRSAGVVHKQDHRNIFDPELARRSIDLANDQIVAHGRDAEKLAALELSEEDVATFLGQFFQPLKPSKKGVEGILQAADRADQAAVLLAKAEQEARQSEVIARMLDPDSQSKVFREVWDSYQNAPGAERGTGWGVLNAVTHWADHKAGWSPDARLTQSWQGARGRTKDQVQTALLKLAA